MSHLALMSCGPPMGYPDLSLSKKPKTSLKERERERQPANVQYISLKLAQTSNCFRQFHPHLKIVSLSWVNIASWLCCAAAAALTVCLQASGLSWMQKKQKKCLPDLAASPCRLVLSQEKVLKDQPKPKKEASHVGAMLHYRNLEDKTNVGSDGPGGGKWNKKLEMRCAPYHEIGARYLGLVESSAVRMSA